MPTSTTTLRRALIAAFKDNYEQLVIFCYDSPDFRVVYDQLTPQHKNDVAELVFMMMEQVHQNEALTTPLLDLLWKYSPPTYAQYFPRPAPISAPPVATKVQPEIIVTLQNPIATVAHTKGLSPDLTQRLREQLLNSGYFNNEQGLPPLFVDQRLYAWRNKLPQANNPTDRVNQVIAALATTYNINGENGLALLLQVLSQQFDSHDMVHHQLAHLAVEVAQALNSEATSSPVKPLQKIAPPSPNFSQLKQQLTQMDDTELDFFCLEHFSEVESKFTDNMAKDRKILLLLKHCQRDNYQSLQAALGS